MVPGLLYDSFAMRFDPGAVEMSTHRRSRRQAPAEPANWPSGTDAPTHLSADDFDIELSRSQRSASASSSNSRRATSPKKRKSDSLVTSAPRTPEQFEEHASRRSVSRHGVIQAKSTPAPEPAPLAPPPSRPVSPYARQPEAAPL